MALIKPSDDWSDEESGFYDGPPPPPGTYRGVVHRMGLSEVQSGDNKGTDKWIVSVKITDGKYKGATVLTSFTMIKSNAWAFNQFLMAMTDGSEKQRQGIKNLYYKKGFKIEDEERYRKLGRQVEYIGTKNFVPIGKPVTFATSMNGEYVNIDRFLIPLEGGSEDTETTETESESDSLEGLEDEDEPEAVAVEEDSSDDDDPWS